MLRKETLLDYIENFILFDNQKTKIIAKNHQFLGVNNLFRQMYKRQELKGKLGVFWHTQGSGKSYSMVMFARKVMRKIVGNFSFLVVTDRDDLDTQIHKTFVRTDVIKQSEIVQPANSEKLREYLGTNQKFVFTLIHKFRYDKKKEYPLLSTRNDIIVMVDEAHRTQYADLAENMRKGLPNANFVAFTGTPLLGTQKLTNQWFGDYVSEYNFAQAIEDGSTVPLFYSRRVPEVGLQNNFLDDDIVKIVEEEKLNDREEEALENAKSKIIEVLDRDDRLEKVAQDIAHHFPRRGFLGKAMVVSVTKYTAVKMYDKVQKYWKIEIQNLYNERNTKWANKKFPPLKYLHDLYTNDIDQEKLEKAKERLNGILDKSISSQNPNDANGASKADYLIHEYKVIDLSKINVEDLRKELKTAEYKAIEIDDIKMFIEMALKKLLEQNKERIKFSERFKAIVDRYNAGGSENEDYYEQLLELMEQLKKESTRAEIEGLSEEELELYDLLIKGKKLTKDEEQKVKLAAKHLFTTLKENKEKLLVVDWYKNEQPIKKVQDMIEESLDKDLPSSYDKPSFDSKIKLILNHFIDMAVQGYGWIYDIA